MKKNKLKKIHRVGLYFFLGVVVICVLGYFLVLSPRAKFRVNFNKLQAHDGGASLYVDAPASINGPDKVFSAKVMVDTAGFNINASSIVLSFDPHVLRIKNVETLESYCRFYTENSYDNDRGEFKLSCGTPYPGFSGKSEVASIQFETIGIGITNLEFAEGCLVLANDGKGTNILKDVSSAAISIEAIL